MDTYQRFDPDPSGPWDRLPPSSGVCSDCILSGHGSPEGVETGTFQGQPYTDIDTGGVYTFIGTPGANTGWS
jgi:hypothetical protein